jgi:hypothetical protein
MCHVKAFHTAVGLRRTNTSHFPSYIFSHSSSKNYSMKLFQRLSIPSLSVLLLTTIFSFSLNPFPFINLNAQVVRVSIKGTSSLHDWEMKSDKGQVEVLMGLNAVENVIGLTSLRFTILAESLKSGKSSMDKNAYKALKTGTAKNISFVMSSSKVTPVNATTVEIRALGKLTVAGTVRDTDLFITVKYNADKKSYAASGSKKIKMTDYDVKPPSFMMGAVKTGDEITMTFNSTITQ